MLSSSMLLALFIQKFYDDLHLSNNYISKVYRVPLKSLNKWEVKVLEILNYSLYIHQAERDQVRPPPVFLCFLLHFIILLASQDSVVK